MQTKIERTTKGVATTLIVLIIISLIDAFTTSNEFAMVDLILEHLLIPILIMSTLMSVYWILLTDDFWLIYEGSEKETWAKTKMALKFFIFIPGMALYFFAVTQGLLSIYNRTMGKQTPVSISGQIVDKDEYRSRRYFEINERTLGRNVELRVDEAEYERFNIGDNYKTEKYIGALGLIYESK